MVISVVMQKYNSMKCYLASVLTKASH